MFFFRFFLFFFDRRLLRLYIKQSCKLIKLICASYLIILFWKSIFYILSILGDLLRRKVFYLVTKEVLLVYLDAFLLQVYWYFDYKKYQLLQFKYFVLSNIVEFLANFEMEGWEYLRYLFLTLKYSLVEKLLKTLEKFDRGEVFLRFLKSFSDWQQHFPSWSWYNNEVVRYLYFVRRDLLEIYTKFFVDGEDIDYVYSAIYVLFLLCFLMQLCLLFLILGIVQQISAYFNIFVFLIFLTVFLIYKAVCLAVGFFTRLKNMYLRYRSRK